MNHDPQNVLSPRSSWERWQGLSLRAPAHTVTSTLASRPRGSILLFKASVCGPLVWQLQETHKRYNSLWGHPPHWVLPPQRVPRTSLAPTHKTAAPAPSQVVTTEMHPDVAKCPQGQSCPWLTPPAEKEAVQQYGVTLTPGPAYLL